MTRYENFYQVFLVKNPWEKTFNNTSNYFNVFSDVYQHKSAKQTLFGILKIISYALIIPPLIICYKYLNTKKITDLQKDFNAKIDTNQIHNLFINTISDPDQNRLVNYLINKINNVEAGDDQELEKQRFEKGFKELTLTKQLTFFKEASNEKCLEKAINWLPNDIKELQFWSPDNNHIHIFLKKFSDLKQLETLFLDLSNGYRHLHGATYRPAAAADLKAMTEQIKNGSETVIISQDVNYGSQSTIVFDASGLIQTFVTLRKRVKENPNLNWAVHFQDLSLSGKGKEISNVSNLGFGLDAMPAINYIKA